jgi:hypothetical protein
MAIANTLAYYVRVAISAVNSIIVHNIAEEISKYVLIVLWLGPTDLHLCSLTGAIYAYI